MERHDVTIDMALMNEISDIVNPHLKALNDDITARYPTAPDMYLSLAIAWQVSVMLGNLSDPDERMSAAQGMTAIIRHTGYALTPVT